MMSAATRRAAFHHVDTAFRQSRLDRLVLGPLLVRVKQEAASRER